MRQVPLPARKLRDGNGHFMGKLKIPIFLKIAHHAAKMKGGKKVLQIEIQNKPLIAVKFCVGNNAFAFLKTVGDGGTEIPLRRQRFAIC